MGYILWQRPYLSENMLYARKKLVWLIMAQLIGEGEICPVGHQFIRPTLM